MNKIGIGVVISGLALLGSGYAWDYNQRDAIHKEIESSLDQEIHAGNIELDLKAIELELKLYRTIEERRPLTPDEQDRRDYLEKLREILLAEQLKKVA